MAIRLFSGDIVSLDVDAIVNAANSTLLGGGGVDGAIHRAAGPGLFAECASLGGCPAGEARLTGGHQLLAGHIIHTVGPVWRGGNQGETRLLRSCYTNSLELATSHQLRSIAFPAISTGVFGFPAVPAAEIAVAVVRSHLEEHPETEVVFVCFDASTTAIYQRLCT